MPSQSDVAARIIATLGITEPDLDTSVGSVTRKIIDAVSESVAESYIDQHLLTYQYDIDSKIEADLDDFVALFGMTRLAPKRATGVVTFYRGSGDSSRAVPIRVNTQIASDTIPSVTVSTVTPAFIAPGVVAVDVPVQAVLAGPAANLGAGSLTRMRNPIDGVMAVTNINPLTGGTAAETDSELRSRWKRTVFRSLAGTQSMYEGIALNDEACASVNVIGATKVYREQVQVIGGVAESSIDDVEFIYADSVVLGPAVDESVILLRDHDYSFDTATRPPRIIMKTTSIPTGEFTENGEEVIVNIEGAILDLIYEYAPRDSRNLPNQGITNRVDLWVNGTRAESAVQTLAFQNNRRFVRDVASPYYFRRFKRSDNKTVPEVGNIFVPLAFGPIITIPSSLSVAGEVYYRGVDYWLVHDDGPFGYSPRSMFGLEWNRLNAPLANSMLRLGGNDTQGDYSYFNDHYTFNAVPRDIQSNIDRWRLVGIDAQVHQAKLQQLRFNLAVMYNPRAIVDVVNTQISQALAAYTATLGFDATVQVQDALQVVHNVAGVDNVRFLEAADWLTYNPGNPNFFGVGIQRVVDGIVIESYVDRETGRPYDVTFGDSELPVFESVRGDRLDPATNAIPAGVPSLRAQNTFFPRQLVAGPTDGGVTYPPPVLTGSATSLADISLSWTAVQGYLGYTVYRGGVRIASFGPANGTPVQLSYKTSADAAYDYTVKGYYAHDNNADTAQYGPPSNVYRPAV